MAWKGNCGKHSEWSQRVCMVRIQRWQRQTPLKPHATGGRHVSIRRRNVLKVAIGICSFVLGLFLFTSSTASLFLADNCLAACHLLATLRHHLLNLQHSTAKQTKRHFRQTELTMRETKRQRFRYSGLGFDSRCYALLHAKDMDARTGCPNRRRLRRRIDVLSAPPFATRPNVCLLHTISMHAIDAPRAHCAVSLCPIV